MVSAFKILRSRLAVSAALAVVLGVFALGTATTALASPVSTPRISLGTSVSCSSKNGVATVKITSKLSTRGDVGTTSVNIHVEPLNNDYSGATQATATIAPASGTYDILIVGTASNASTVAQKGTAIVNGGKCKVTVRSWDPV
jgi:hypothetical protein